MAGKTRSMVLEGIGKIALQEFPIPKTGEEDGLRRGEMCGICGSDVGIYNGKNIRV